MSTRWMIYGAYGYTGRLLVDEAVRRGHAPTLAGRSLEKLRPLAEAKGLPYVQADLGEPRSLLEVVQGHALVLHAAGPFIHTQRPMLRACLEAGAHYLDITGEIPAFETAFAHDREARERGIAIISGVGFDVVPTDCLALYVAKQVTDPVSLDIAFAPEGGGTSAGTLKSALEFLPRGGFVRKDGVLVPFPLGKGARKVRFPHGERTVLPIPWGDLSTAFHTTAIGDITTSIAVGSKQVRALRVLAPVGRLALGAPPLRKALLRLVETKVEGPDEAARERGRSHVYAEAKDAKGGSARAWLTTAEGYRFTAAAGIRAVEKTLEGALRGALTPARAFGEDFVLEIPGTTRLDALP